MTAKKLKYGDTVGIIAPASPEEPEKIKRCIETLESFGFSVKEGPHLYDRCGYLAGKDEDRAQDFMDMFMDSEVDAVMCFRGGYGSMRTMAQVNFNVVRENPKAFIGFSDITLFLNYMALSCGLITFHGPMTSSNLEDDYTFNSFINTLMNGTKPYTLSVPSEIPMEFHGDHSAEGILVGGNLSLICSALSTPFDIDMNDKILFIEEVGEEPYRIDRMLTQLLLAGKLKSCKGFILGQFTDCQPHNTHQNLMLNEILQDRILKLNKPTIINFPTGHDYPKLTIPIGARIRLDYINQKIQVLEPVVK